MDTGAWLKRFNAVDIALMSVLVLVAVGIIVVQSGLHQTSSQVVDGEADIEYTVMLRNIKTLNPNGLFKMGQELALTIRNQPRGKVEVVALRQKPKQIVVTKPDGNLLVIPDPDDWLGFDYLVKFRDHAKLTDDGYVANGIKIKTGMKITVEGFDFQLPGVIVDVGRVLTKAEEESAALKQRELEAQLKQQQAAAEKASKAQKPPAKPSKPAPKKK